MPLQLPTYIMGVSVEKIRACLPDVSRFTLNDYDWGIFIEACDLFEEASDDLSDNLRHKYCLQAGNVEREDMIQLMNNLNEYSYYQPSSEELEQWDETRESFAEKQEAACSWVWDFIDCYVGGVV